MFCPKCGNELPDGSAFCGKCGERLGNPGPVAESGTLKSATGGRAKAPAPKKKAPRAVIAGVAVAVLVVAAAVCVFTFGDFGQPEDRGDASPEAAIPEETRELLKHVISDSSMSSVGGNLEPAGYRRTNEQGLSYELTKGGNVVTVTGEYRTLVMEGVDDMYALLRDGGPGFDRLADFKGPAGDFVIGLDDEVAGTEGVVVASETDIIVVPAGHMSTLRTLSSKVTTTDSMKAEEAAGKVVAWLESQGYEHADGDEIAAYGEDEEFTLGNGESIFGKYDDPRGQATDTHGYFRSCEITKRVNSGEPYLRIEWIPARYDENGDEIKLAYRSAEFGVPLDVHEDGGVLTFDSVEPEQDASHTYFDVSGEFTEKGMKLTGGVWTVDLQDGGKLNLSLSDIEFVKQGSSATTSEVLGDGNFKVVGVNLRATRPEGESGGAYAYVLTGTLENDGKVDAAQVNLALTFSKAASKSDGSEDVERGYTLSARDEGVSNITPLSTGTSFFNVVAGEKRQFTLEFKSSSELSEPVFTVDSVWGSHTTPDEFAGFLNDKFKVADAATFNAVVSVNEDDEVVARLTNTTRAELMKYVVRIAYSDKYGINHVGFAEGEGLPAGEDGEVTFSFPFTFLAFDAAWDEADLRALDVWYMES